MKPSKADKAVAHIMRLMQSDGRLAYLIGYGSESFRLLVEASAETSGVDATDLAITFAKTLKPQRVRLAKEDAT